MGWEYRNDLNDLPPGLGDDEHPKPGEATTLCSCLGIGFKNLNRAFT